MVQVNQRVLKERILWRHCTPKGGVTSLDQLEYVSLQTAIDKLILNDSSITVHRDSSIALGQGWRVGFLSLGLCSILTFPPSALSSRPSSLSSVYHEFGWFEPRERRDRSQCDERYRPAPKWAAALQTARMCTRVCSKFSGWQAHTGCGWLDLDLNASYEALESSTLVLWTLAHTLLGS